MSSWRSTTPSYTDGQRREAANWFVDIHVETNPKAETIQAWLRWMDRDDGNRAAFDAISRAWHGTPSAVALKMPAAAELLADDYDGEQSVEEWLAQQATAKSAPNEQAQYGEERPRLSRRAWFAVAASLVVVVLGLLAVRHYDVSSRSDANEFVTRTGEQIEITLADGSHVWLGPKSKLRVAFAKTQRGIQLAGEAFFSVKKDRHRPFTVRSAGGDIVAVGTAFNVRALDGRVTVDVSEGIVAVTPKAQLAVPEPASVRVASGQQLTFIAEQPIKALAIVQSAPGARARWRDGVLVYRDEPLQDVINDVVRYSDIQIELADKSVGDLHYSGVIYREAVHEWISALPESFPVTVVSDGTREIIKARVSERDGPASY